MSEELPPLEEFTETTPDAAPPAPTSPAKTSSVDEAVVEAVPETASSTTPTATLNIKDLGYYLDGWADLVEGKAEQADKVYQSTVDVLRQRFPVSPATKFVVKDNKLVHDKTRSYISTENWPGATTTIYVGPRGEDLYVSWRTYIKPVLNSQTIAIIVVIGLFAGVLMSEGSISSATFIIGASLIMLMGFGFAAAAGRMQKGDASAYFYKEPSIMDAEDITGMSMAAHKSLHRALDKEGIDVKQLRLKQNFVGGRRDEAI